MSLTPDGLGAVLPPRGGADAHVEKFGQSGLELVRGFQGVNPLEPERVMANEMGLQIRIHDLHLATDVESEEQRVVVEGSSPQGPVSASVLHGPAANLVTQVLTTAGLNVLRARLGVEPRLWFCTPCARQMVDGILCLDVRDAACIGSLCEHIRAAVFVSERGEPILEGFPPNQENGGGG